MKNSKITTVVMYLLVLIGLTSIIQCTQEDAIEVKADFSVKAYKEDYSVPVRMQITNNTEGADTYEWTFEGGYPSSSTAKYPGDVTYDAPGTYIIKLRAYNRDGSEQFIEKTFTVDPAVVVGFDVEVIQSNYAPVEVKIKNTTQGATTYKWTFEGGSVTNSTDKDPANVIFTTPGDHKITLEVSNGKETYTLEKVVTVEKALQAAFDWTTDAYDDDYEAPVPLTLNNQSVSATAYEWTISGATPSTSTEASPKVVFNTPGTYTITLKASNDKSSVTTSKQITILPDTNLRTIKDIKLGINSAHSTIGSFYSTTMRKVYTASEVNSLVGGEIDLPFFGLNSTFTYNQFLSPDEVQYKTFVAIPNATHTIFINSQELVGMNFSASNFDALTNDTALKSLNITETTAGKRDFTNSKVPRIVLFKTQDGRKGAIKIKEFVSAGTQSYITCDIKVQKKAQ